MTVGISAYDITATDLLDLSVAADDAGFDTLWLRSGRSRALPTGSGWRPACTSCRFAIR
jgi:alkanesulfonate monooxygenase SsuD/methylene tetrahydromethanopterin reductase-like flavin-dependent oxidoreductase (luciferase family)